MDALLSQPLPTLMPASFNFLDYTISKRMLMKKVYLPLIVIDFQKKLMEDQFKSLVVAHHEKTRPHSYVAHPSKEDVSISRVIVYPPQKKTTQPPNHKEKYTILWVINQPFNLDEWIDNYDQLGQSRLLTHQQPIILAYDGDFPFQEQTSLMAFLNNKGHNVMSLCLNTIDANEQCCQIALTHLVTQVFSSTSIENLKKQYLKHAKPLRTSTLAKLFTNTQDPHDVIHRLIKKVEKHVSRGTTDQSASFKTLMHFGFLLHQDLIEHYLTYHNEENTQDSQRPMLNTMRSLSELHKTLQGVSHIKNIYNRHAFSRISQRKKLFTTDFQSTVANLTKRAKEHQNKNPNAQSASIKTLKTLYQLKIIK